MPTSKEIIERTGISRATLNNYIASGLVPRPDVLPPGPDQGAAPRIGHFPEGTVERIEAIQRLKRQGWSIARIAEHLAGGGREPLPAPATVAQPEPLRPVAPGTPVAVPGVPTLAAVAMLVTTLEDAAGLWVRLAASEYFELVNEVWAELDAVFRGHGGIAVRHPDEGMTSCFRAGASGSYLWNALAAAQAAREAMRRVSLRWRERKAWDRQLFMNTGIDAGDDWVGRVGAGDLRVLGEATLRAGQLSHCGGGGSILATRRLVGMLAPGELGRLTYGVPRAAGADSATRLLFSFTRLADIGAAGLVPASLADLAVAEVLDVRLRPAGPGPAGTQ